MNLSEKMGTVEAAEFLLSLWRAAPDVQLIGAIKVIVAWRGEYYIGSIQSVYREYSAQIIYLSKASHTISDSTKDVICDRDSSVQLLTVDEEIDLTGNYHFLWREGDRLTVMSSEAVEYVKSHPKNIIEVG
jgi:hypothetical protein